MRVPIVLAFLAALLLTPDPAGAQAANQTTNDLDAPRVTFTSPALDKVWAAAGPETRPAPMPIPAEALTVAPYGRVVLETWARALEHLVQDGTPLEARLTARLQLCLIAKAQARHQDAWTHFQRLADGPGEVVRALPYLWPGVPFETPVGPGGRLRLPKDALLQPAFLLLPPDGSPGPAGPPRMAWKGGLLVQDKPLELRITLQPEGLEMDLWNRGKSPLQVRAILPTPRNFESSYTYSDWEKTVDAHLGMTVELPPDREDPWTLFTRLKPAYEAWPRSPKAGARWFEGRKMRLILGRNEEPTEALQTLAKVLRGLLGIPVDFAAMDDKAPIRSVIVDLGPASPPQAPPTPAGSPSPRQARMRRLLSSVELFLLP